MNDHTIVYSIYKQFELGIKHYGEDFKFAEDIFKSLVLYNGISAKPIPITHRDYASYGANYYIVANKYMLKDFCCELKTHEELEEKYKDYHLVGTPPEIITYPRACLIYNPEEPRHIFYVRPPLKGVQKNPKRFKKGDVPLLVSSFNSQHGVTKQVQSAMLEGARSGWYKPTSNPKNYNSEGVYIGFPQREKGVSL